MKDAHLVDTTATNISNDRITTPRFLDMSLPPSRFFGPVLGVLLANMLFKAVTAKYSSYVPLQLSYQPTWLSYGKPFPSYDYHPSQYPSQWYPVKNPHPVSYQTYPTLTTGAPLAHAFHHQDLAASGYDYDSHYPEEAKNHNTITNLEKPGNIEEPIPAESNVNVKRRAPQNFRRRIQSQRGSNRNKYPQKRRRTTTPPPPEDYYYDSYEEFTTETNRRRRPYMEDSTEFYEDDDYYDYETTTKKKLRRRPTKSKKRRGETTTAPYSEFDSDEVVGVNPHTEIVIVRQAQTTTTTTTQPSTIITNGTTTTESTLSTSVQPSNTTINSTSYGYGPSNGNEGISITYGPPVGNGKYYYSSPYFDWYTHDATRNAIVKKVRDIVTYDKKFNLKK